MAIVTNITLEAERELQRLSVHYEFGYGETYRFNSKRIPGNSSLEIADEFTIENVSFIVVGGTLQIKAAITVEEAIELIDEYFYEGEIQGNKFVLGINLLVKYDPDLHPEFGHDICWLSNFEETIAKMTREEIIFLAQCGFRYNSENGCWAHG